MIYELCEIQALTRGVSAEINGRWVPARPIGYPSLWHRLKAAWLVFTGTADRGKE